MIKIVKNPHLAFFMVVSCLIHIWSKFSINKISLKKTVLSWNRRRNTSYTMDLFWWKKFNWKNFLTKENCLNKTFLRESFFWWVKERKIFRLSNKADSFWKCQFPKRQFNKSFFSLAEDDSQLCIFTLTRINASSLIDTVCFRDLSQVFCFLKMTAKCTVLQLQESRLLGLKISCESGI